MVVRDIGLHVRLTNSFVEGIERAAALQMPVFQCFLLDQVQRKPITIDKKTIVALQAAREKFKEIFIHASYWINLADLSSSGYNVLKRELKDAQRLDIRYVIFHPGSAVKLATHRDGIESVAKVINEMNRLYPEIVMVLENTCHAGKTVGSDFKDLQAIKQLIDFPDRVAFCVDTAHAYAYGYDFSDEKKQEEFITTIDTTIGIDRLVLIHLNDAFHHICSRIDKHALIGEGKIGAASLKSLAQADRLAHLPIILELPLLPDEHEHEALQHARTLLS